jgi:peptide-methionine (S)-S-oxide reductase
MSRTPRNQGAHAEAIEIKFDLSQTSFRDLLEFFLHIHTRPPTACEF